MEMSVSEFIDFMERIDESGQMKGLQDYDKVFNELNEARKRIEALEAEIAEHDKHVLDTLTFHPEDGETANPPHIIEDDGITWVYIGACLFDRPRQVLYDAAPWWKNFNYQTYLNIKAPPEIWQRFPNRPRIVIPWSGGECPVDNQVSVDVFLDDEGPYECKAEKWGWSSCEGPGAITAFTITEGMEEAE